eukprot:4241691-Heterocapsa_arctica.AAC.1
MFGWDGPLVRQVAPRRAPDCGDQLGVGKTNLKTVTTIRTERDVRNVAPPRGGLEDPLVEE